MSRKWIAVGLVVGLLAVAVTGGAVLASGGNPDEGGGDEAQEVVVKDGDVAVQSIENTEVESGEPDALAVRIAEILGTDPDATSDAMAQVDAAVETGPGRSEADVHEHEPGVDAMSVEAEGLSYFEYGTRLGAILGVDGERAASRHRPGV